VASELKALPCSIVAVDLLALQPVTMMGEQGFPFTRSG
jgi:hypothetical protein